MKLRNCFFTALAIASASVPVMAKEISADEAMSRAASFVGAHTSGMQKAPAAGTMRLAYQAKAAKAGKAAFYVFDKGTDNGFVIASADDRLPSVLGYSSTGTFEYDKMPENLRWWLDCYQQEIDAFLSVEEPAAMAKPMKSAVVRQKVSPLVTTKWNQSAPYNNMCPEDAGGRSVTGCAATAIAQIINYHKYPSKGTGSYSYSWNGKTLSYDFGNASFDWNNMLNAYSYSGGQPNFTAAQGDAVANLMLACGIGLNMQYSSGESSAYDVGTPHLLVDNMGYDGGVQICLRENYNLTDWEDLVYSELQAGRPVFYSGQANQGGHAFVCDGYTGENYFHINWGWGGMSDGEFLLSALNPHDQGIGSYEGGYNQAQRAIIGIQPDKGSVRFANILSPDGAFSVYPGTNNAFNLERFFNYSWFDASVTLGVMAVSESDPDMVKYFDGENLALPGCNMSNGNISGYNNYGYYCDFKSLPAGTYKAYPAYRMKDNTTEWRRIRVPAEKQQYVVLTVDASGNYTLSDPGVSVDYDLTVTDFNLPDKCYKGYDASFIVGVTNNSSEDYNNQIGMRICSNGVEKEAISLQYQVGAKSSVSRSFTYAFNLDAGNYDVYFYDATGKLLNDTPFNMTVEPGEPPVIPAGVYLINVSPRIYYTDTRDAPVFTVKNTSKEDYTDTFYIRFFKPDGSYYDVAYFTCTLEASTALNLRVNNVPFTMHAGNYTLGLTDKNGKLFGETFPVKVYQEVGSYWYGLTDDETGAEIIASPISNEKIETLVDVPASVTIADKEYNVTKILDGAFYNCTSLKYVYLRGATVPFSDAMDVFRGYTDNVEFYVNGDSYAGYSSAVSPLTKNVYSIIDSFTYLIKEGNPRDISSVPLVYDIEFQPTENVNPLVDIKCSPENLLEINASPLTDGKIRVTAAAAADGEGTITMTSGQPFGVAPLMIPVSVKKTTTGVDGVENTAAAVYTDGNSIVVTGVAVGQMVSLYGLDGVMLQSAVGDGLAMRFSNLEKGMYVVRFGSEVAKVRL